jgi:hypothetical protein
MKKMGLLAGMALIAASVSGLNPAAPGVGGDNYFESFTLTETVTGGTAAIVEQGFDQGAQFVRLEATAETGYEFAYWACSGTTGDTEVTPTTLTLLGNDASCEPVFNYLPPVASVVAPASGTYNAGSDLVFQVTWTLPGEYDYLVADSNAKIPLAIGDAERYAVADECNSCGLGGATVTFRYTVQSSDIDTDGIEVGPEIVLTGGDGLRIQNSEPVGLALGAITTSGVLVNGSIMPSVTNTNDIGPGSLRAAIIAASALTGPNTITFAEELECDSVPCTTITLSSRLPDIVDDVTITGPGAADLTITGPGIQLINVTNTGELTLSGVTIANSGNAGSSFGPVANDGTLTVTNSTFRANTGREGGAIFNSGTLEVTNSTFDANIAALGGAIWHVVGTATVTNSTFHANLATLRTDEGGGGGIYNRGFGSVLTVVNSTFTANQGRSGSGQGGGGIHNSGTLHLTNTILWNNTNHLGVGDDCTGNALSTNVTNLIGIGTGGCGTGAVTTNPLLGSLADNGGPTQTMAIPADSPAFNTGTNTGCPTTDQRGAQRAGDVEDPCDIGAYEVQGWLRLATLSLSAGTLDPVFAAGTKEYTASVDNATTSIDVTATLVDLTGVDESLTWRLRNQAGDNAYVSFTSPQAVSLAVGANTIELKVTMGAANSVYTVVVTREGGGGGGDTDPPSVTTFALQTASDTGAADDDKLTNAAVLVYDLVFNEPVFGLSASAFTVSGTATKCSVGVAASSTTTYTVTLSKCTNGTVTLTLNADTVADGAENVGPEDNSYRAADAVTIDRIAPAVTVFAGNTTNGYTITFQEPVTGLATSDFTLSGRSLGSCAVSTTAGTDSPTVVNGIQFHQSWTVQVTNCPTSLALTLDNGAVEDIAGNLGPSRAVRARTTKT